MTIRTMEEALAESIAPRRFNLLLLGIFALVALVLAALGVYGVVAYAVAERTQEIGIRLALGAERARVVRMIVSQGMMSVLTGIGVGLVVSLRVPRGCSQACCTASAVTTCRPSQLATLLLGVIAFMACAAPALARRLCRSGDCLARRVNDSG